MMSPETFDFAIAIPATALVTETAGVNTPSAIVRLNWHECIPKLITNSIAYAVPNRHYRARS